jgi:hypothetical protein
MNIVKSTVTKMVISGVPRLDPITVFAEDVAPRQGKLTIECYGQSWSAYWGGMGDCTLPEFLASVNVDYAANCLSRGMNTSIFDPDAVIASAKKNICSERRKHYIGADEAREQFDEIDGKTIGDDPWQNSALMEKIYGDEWWCQLPEKPNPDWQYLCRIVTAVQAALAAELVPA